MAYQGPPGSQPPYYGPPGGPPPYPPQGYRPPPRRGRGPAFWVLVVGVPLAVLVGCMAAIGAVVNPQPVAERTPLQFSPTVAAPTVTVTEQATPEVAGAATTEATQEPTSAPETSAPAIEKAALPDVVGMNLQAAQDTMQAAGFYFLDDQDDTGQNRLQVYDRNWVVTRQEPAAGKKVPADTKVVLWAKKYGE